MIFDGLVGFIRASQNCDTNCNIKSTLSQVNIANLYFNKPIIPIILKPEWSTIKSMLTSIMIIKMLFVKRRISETLAYIRSEAHKIQH